MERLVDLLIKQKITISAMESITGGLFTARLTEYSGVSSILLGTLVTYTDQIKVNLGKVDESIIKRHGAISQQTAQAMAINCQKLFKSRIAVSFTGNAGPLTQEDKPVGLVFSAIVYDQSLYEFEDQLNGSRFKIRNDIINLTVERLLVILGKE
jgi:PncC family amidohydrolase